MTVGGYLQRQDIAENVLKFLPLKDLLRVALVSRRMHVLASDPLLWDGVSLNHNNLTNQGLSQYFSDCKFVRFRRLRLLSQNPFTEEDSTTLLEHLKASGNKIRELDLRSCNLKDVSPGMLAEIVANVMIVKMDNFTKLSSRHWQQIFTYVSKSQNLVLKELNLCSVKIGHVSPNLLATALIKIEKVNLEQSKITKEQIHAIMTHIINSQNVLLKDLDLCEIDLREISPDILAAGALSLEKVSLERAKTTAKQTKEILTRISSSKNLLIKDLDLCGIDFSEVPRDLINAGMSKVVRRSFTATQAWYIYMKPKF